MIKSILRRIAGNAAKSVFQTIYILGIATVNDIRESGIGETSTYEAIAELKAGGFIIRVGFGVYRCSQNSAIAEKDSAPAESIVESCGGNLPPNFFR